MKHQRLDAISERMRPLLRLAGARKIKIRGLAIGLALMTAYGAFWFFDDQFEIWNARIFDHVALLRSQARPAREHDGPSVLSIDSIFYFDRSHHAQVIQNLAAMDVSAQVTDFIFSAKVDDQVDGALILATEAAGNVYFGMSFASLAESPAPAPSDQPPEVARYLEATKWEVRLDGEPAAIYVGLKPQITYPQLSAASKGIGFVNVTPDADGIMRRIPLLVRYGDAFYPSLSFRVACDSLGLSPGNLIIKPGRSITLTGLKRHAGNSASEIIIPIDKHGNMRLNFAAVEPQTRKYSYREIIQASGPSSSFEALKAELSGKIVILSETVEKPFKIRSSRGEEAVPLVAIHTAVIQNIITGSYLRVMSDIATGFVEMALLALLFILSLRFSSLSFLIGAVLAVGVYASAGVFCFYSANLVFQFTQPVFVVLCALTTLLTGMGIEKAMLSAETERARRMAEHELEIGREIQAGFFPTTLPAVPGWEVKIYFRAARYVAGDFYDIFTMGSKSKIGIVTADVCDKGVGAALFMALLRSFIRVLSGRAVRENYLDNKGNAEDILLQTFESINNYISITHEQAAMFATVFYGILDPESGDLHYINGGQEPPVIVSAGRIRTLLPPTGPAVGLQPDLNYKIGQTVMAPGDTLIVYTDGVIDALDKTGHAFTKGRLQGLLQQPAGSAEVLIERIKQHVSAHINGVDQYDDITVTVIRREPGDKHL